MRLQNVSINKKKKKNSLHFLFQVSSTLNVIQSKSIKVFPSIFHLADFVYKSEFVFCRKLPSIFSFSLYSFNSSNSPPLKNCINSFRLLFSFFRILPFQGFHFFTNFKGLYYTLYFTSDITKSLKPFSER